MKSKLFVFLVALLAIPAFIFAQCSYTVSTTIVNNVCYNGTTGSITVSVTGGTSPYQYQLAEAGAGAWQSGNIFPALAAGTYPVSVMDATGCVTTVYKTITQPTQLAVGYNSANPTCTLGTNGNIAINPSGGTAPYTYNWTKNGTAFATTQNLTGLSAGNYFLVVTDNNGCTASPIIAQQVLPVALSGFNEDAIAEGNSVAATTVTTQSMDAGTGFDFYASGYKNTSGVTGSGGLPSTGNFTSAQTSSRTYQLASYTGNNDLLIRSSGDASYGGSTSGTLTFLTQNQSPYSTLYVIGTTGSGTGTVNYTVNYTDGTSMTPGSLSFPDWSLPITTASTVRALGSLDRVGRTASSTFDNSTNFNLWEAPVTVGNQTKSVKSIDFSWSAASSARINLFAVTGYTATGNGIRINDGASSNGLPAVAVISDATSNQFCSGQSVVFTAIPAFGGTSPSYQWYKNSVVISGATGSTYTSNSLANNDQISVIMTASGGVACLTTTSATSAALTMVLAPKAASVAVTTAVTSTCAGNAVKFAATPVNGGASPSYQWMLNSIIPVGTNSPAYTTTLLNNGDAVSVIMTSSIGCATGSPATSASVPMTVSANALPVSVIATSAPMVTFSSANLYLGSSPAYQWYKNGVIIPGATGSTYFKSSPSIGDLYSLKVTSNYTCALAPAAMSNYINITSALLLPVKMEWLQPQVTDNNVLLKWKTSYESQNKDFIVQRALSSSANYESIGSVASLNQVTGSTYSFMDQPPVNGTYYYRLIQEDADGKQTISDNISVTILYNKSWQVTDKGTYWQIQNNSGLLHYYLMDNQGKLIQKGIVNGTASVTKPASEAIYILRVVVNGVASTQKLKK